MDIPRPTLYASTLRLLDQRIAITSALHDLKITITSATLMEYLLTSLHRSFCTITSPLRIMVGSTPSNVFATCLRLCAYCISLYTRDLDVAGYDFPRALACNFDTYRYSLLPAHMPFIFCCTYTISLLWPRTSPHEDNHHYIRFIPHIHLNSFFPLSLDRPFTVRVDCTDIYTHFLLPSLPHFKFLDVLTSLLAPEPLLVRWNHPCALATRLHPSPPPVVW